MKKKETSKNKFPAWLYMTMSFVIPVYGILYYVMLKDKDPRAKVAGFFAALGIGAWIIIKMIVWI